MPTDDVKKTRIYLRTEEKEMLITLALSSKFVSHVVDNAGEGADFSSTRKIKLEGLRSAMVAQYPRLEELTAKEFDRRVRQVKEDAMKLRRDDLKAYDETGNLPLVLVKEPSYVLSMAMHLMPIRGKIAGAISSSIKRTTVSDAGSVLKRVRLSDEPSQTHTDQSDVDSFTDLGDLAKRQAFLQKFASAKKANSFEFIDIENENMEEEMEMQEVAGPSTSSGLYYAPTARAPRSNATKENEKVIKALEKIAVGQEKSHRLQEETNDLLKRLIAKLE